MKLSNETKKMMKERITIGQYHPCLNGARLIKIGYKYLTFFDGNKRYKINKEDYFYSYKYTF